MNQLTADETNTISSKKATKLSTTGKFLVGLTGMNYFII